jgi:hypothetical protein
MKFASILLLSILFLLTSCVSKPPKNVDNVCRIFKQYPKWYREAKDVQRRWLVPIAVQMAIIHQESKFDGKAKPPHTKLLWVIPWKRASSAYGYSQALTPTWAQYRKTEGGFLSTRDNFGDAVDFIGWYANQAYVRAKIRRNDAYHLYLAYHEGVGGYMRKSYLKKPWLIHVAHKVNSRAQIYQAQLNRCKPHR